MKNLLRWLASKDIPRGYNQLFLSVLVVAGLASFFMSPSIDLRNTGNNIWGKSWLMESYARIRYHLGDQILEPYLAARDGWFVYIEEDSLDDYQNTQPFASQDLADIQRKLDKLSDLLESKGIKFLVIIPPNKNTIYPGYMPPKIPLIGSQSRLDQLIAYEKDHGKFKVMDLRSDLLLASNEHQTYFPCGTHWNTFGAFIAYRDIMNPLEKDFPNLKPHSLDQYRFVNLPGEYDSIMTPTDISDCNSIGLEPLFNHVITQQILTPAENTTKIITINGDSSLPRLLMYRDSFTKYLIPFLSDHFSQAVYLSSYPTSKLNSDIDNAKPDVVIIECAERYLNVLLTIPG